MPVFIVIVREEVDNVKERIDAFPADSIYALTNDSWLVNYNGTTQAFAEKIGLKGDNKVSGVSGMAFPITNYAGFFVTSVWEWLNLHMTRGDV